MLLTLLAKVVQEKDEFRDSNCQFKNEINDFRAFVYALEEDLIFCSPGLILLKIKYRISLGIWLNYNAS